jgi:hypothetical protein
MSQRKPHCSSFMEWVRVTGRSAAHLAGVTIALKHPCPGLLGYSPGERRPPLRVWHEILAGLELCSILVSQDAITLLIP